MHQAYGLAVGVFRKPSCEAGALQQLVEMRSAAPKYTAAAATAAAGDAAAAYRAEEEGLQAVANAAVVKARAILCVAY